MDFPCSFQQPNVLCGSESTICRTLNGFNSHLKFRCRGVGCNFLGNSRLTSKAYQKKKLNKVIVCSTSSVHSGIPAIGEFNSHLWGYKSCDSVVYKFINVFNTSRGVVWSQCQGSDSVAYIDSNGQHVEFVEGHEESSRVGTNVSPELHGSGEEVGEGKDMERRTLDELRELLQMALKELEVARLSSTMFEEKAQRTSEAAIALKDEAANAWASINSTVNTFQDIAKKETVAKEAVQKATMALSLDEARLQVAVDSLEAAT